MRAGSWEVAGAPLQKVAQLPRILERVFSVAVAAPLARRKKTFGRCPCGGPSPNSTTQWRKPWTSRTWAWTSSRTDFSHDPVYTAVVIVNHTSNHDAAHAQPCISWEDSDESYAPPRWVPQLHAACQLRTRLCATEEAPDTQTQNADHHLNHSNHAHSSCQAVTFPIFPSQERQRAENLLHKFLEQGKKADRHEPRPFSIIYIYIYIYICFFI